MTPLPDILRRSRLIISKELAKQTKLTMSTAQQIIDLLTSAPSDENIIQAVEWINSKKSSDKSAMLVVQTLMNIPQAGGHLGALTEWLKSAKDWDCFQSTHKLTSLDHLDWLLLLLRERPNNPQAGLVWRNLLSSYRNREIFEGASAWLQDSAQNDDYADSVAAYLLDETSSPEIIKRSKELLERQPQSFLLARALLRQAPDDHTIDIGVAILNSDEPVIGSMVAGALSRSGKRGADAVSKFIDEHRKSKRLARILDNLIYQAPELAFPLIREWALKNPKSTDSQRLLVECFCQEPTEECAQLLWNCTKVGGGKSAILNVLTIIATDVPVPLEVITYAKNWLESNRDRHIWSKVFKEVIRRISLSEQEELLKRWSDRISEDLFSHFAAVIITMARTRNIDEENIWNWLSTINPSSADFAQFKRKVEDEIASIENSLIESQYPIASKISATDPETIQTAKDWLTTRRLEWRWSSLHEYRGQIIAALLTVSPDQFTATEARRWLEKKQELHFESIYAKVSDLYKAHLETNGELCSEVGAENF